MLNEETVGQETESTPETGTETVVDTSEKTATEEFKEGLAKIQQEQSEDTPTETEGEEAPVVDKQKPEVETEEIDEAEALKRAGITQKSLEDVKTDLTRLGNQAETWNWANKNIPGFADFVTQRMLAARGLEAKGAESIDEFGKTLDDKKAPAGEKGLLEKGYSQEQINSFKEMAAKLDLVSRDEIVADKKAESDKKAKDEAVATFTNFGKSEKVAEQLKALNLDWDKDVKAAVTKVLLDDFGISDFGHVNPKNIARAFNAYIMEKDGGIEQLLGNVKSEAVKEHEEKLKLGKVVPETGAITPSAPKDIEAWLHDPNTSADDIKKKMQALDKRR